MFFDSNSSRKRQVSMSGKRAARTGNASKEDFVQRNKRERAERELEKQRRDGATKIQASARSSAVRDSLKQSVREGWMPERSLRTTWKLLYFYQRGRDDDLLRLQLAQLHPYSAFFLQETTPEHATLSRLKLLEVAVDHFRDAVNTVSSAGVAVLEPWLSTEASARSAESEYLRFATDTQTTWPVDSSSSAAVLRAAEAQVFVQLRACIGTLLGGGRSDLLRGAIQMACAPLASTQEHSHSMLCSFAFRILSIKNLLKLLLNDPISTEMLAMCEAVTLFPHKLPEPNSALLVLGNLAHLLKIHSNHLQLLGAYTAAMHALLKATPAHVLRAPADYGIVESVKALTEEWHVRLMLVETSVVAESVGSQAEGPRELSAQGALYHSVASFGLLADGLPKDFSVRMLHLIASPTLGVVRVMWSWMTGSLDFQLAMSCSNERTRSSPHASPAADDLDYFGAQTQALYSPEVNIMTQSDLLNVFSLFCRAFDSRLRLLDDDEFYLKLSLLPLDQLELLVVTLTRFISQVYWLHSSKAAHTTFEPMCKLLKNLHQKNARRPFASEQAFVPSLIPANYFDVSAGGADPRLTNILRDVPHFAPFAFRARLFQTQVEDDYRTQSRDVWASHTRIRIRRGYEVEDGFDALYAQGNTIRNHVRVQYIDEHGAEEAGIDGGGLFKEFLTSLIKQGFNPDYGLFKQTAENYVYPNPGSEMFGDRHLQFISFLGKMVGKAVYEGILVELPFANFFLNKLLGNINLVGDLYSLDPERARNLMMLKEMGSDLDDLGLTFEVSETHGFGQVREVELLPGGSRTGVTQANHIQYIYYMADYYLNRQISRQCRAFLAGFQEMITKESLEMFASSELQLLISGADEGIDLEDFKAHCTYSGAYNAQHPTIKNFWKAVSSFTREEQSQLLRFVTSCSRPPLLGFKYMQPPFNVSYGGKADSQDARLPSASTCINLLKLPDYETYYTLRDKLQYAITSNAGFGLS